MIFSADNNCCHFPCNFWSRCMLYNQCPVNNGIFDVSINACYNQCPVSMHTILHNVPAIYVYVIWKENTGPISTCDLCQHDRWVITRTAASSS